MQRAKKLIGGVNRKKTSSDKTSGGEPQIPHGSDSPDDHLKWSRFDSFLYQQYFGKRNKLLKEFFTRYRRMKLKFTDPIVYYRGKEYNVYLPLSQNLFFYQQSYPYFDKRLRYINRFIKKCQGAKNLTVVDIGANIGDTILEMGPENWDDFYIAIEGASKYNRLMDFNLEVNKLKNYKIYRTFLTDSEESGSYSNVCNDGTGHLVKDVNGNAQMHTLDELLKDRVKRLDLIKVDTDGFDYKVLRGSHKILLEDRPVLYFEYGIKEWLEQGEDVEAVFDFLTEHGYDNGLFFDNYGRIYDIIDFSDKQKLKKAVETVLCKESDIWYYDIATIHRNVRGNAADLKKYLEGI